MKACATGEHIKEATITVRKAGKGQQEFLIIKMSDVIITGVHPSGTPNDGGMVENVSIAGAKVDVEYKPQKPDGSLDAGVKFKYDIKAEQIDVIERASGRRVRRDAASDDRTAMGNPSTGSTNDMYFKVKGASHGQINGEALDDKHKGEIEVLSWSWGMQGKSSVGGGQATGKATMRELRIAQRSQNVCCG